ncbi:MAG: hypothetical protein KBB01_04785 [Candidatus Omnitrophica bacterium]|jgi:hypothetical protein|nr:hypothetical protein [Candidatus Omnitrophota bacterium]
MNKDNSQKELPLCPACLTKIEPNVDFCKKCGRPLGNWVTYDPINRIHSVGWLYRRLASGPVPLIALIGVWLIFGPTLLIGIAYMKSGESFGIIIGVLLILVSGIILYRVTRNYLSHRKK